MPQLHCKFGMMSYVFLLIFSKIEGIEHMHNLQKMNLAGNEIEHIPVWLGKKLRSLRILNLKQNKVSSVSDLVSMFCIYKRASEMNILNNTVSKGVMVFRRRKKPALSIPHDRS